MRQFIEIITRGVNSQNRSGIGAEASFAVPVGLLNRENSFAGRYPGNLKWPS